MTDSWQICFKVGDKIAISIFEIALNPISDAFLIQENEGDVTYNVVVFFVKKPNLEDLKKRITFAATSSGILEPPIELEKISSRDWLAEFRLKTAPLKIGNFFVYPDHFEDVIPPDLAPIAIDSGLAFGTGKHQSTKGCLLALGALFKSNHVVKLALDIGCGSGILSIATARLWPNAQILAFDNDSTAVTTAKENVKKNNTNERISVFKNDLLNQNEFSSEETFDLICANILANPLIKSAPFICRYLSSSGALVLSGILDYQETEVEQAYGYSGLILKNRFLCDEWVTIVMSSD